MSRPPEISALVLALAALAACKRSEPPAPAPEGVTSSSAATAATAALASSVSIAPAPTIGAATNEEHAAPFVTGRVLRAKSIGNTSVVFKIELDGGNKAAFKPRSRRGPQRYKGEVAAYRLGQALGLDAVPEAYFRTVPKDDLVRAAAVDPKAKRLVAEEVVFEDAATRGAVIPWIDGYEVLRLEKEPLLSMVKTGLRRGGAIPKEHERIVHETSDLVVFDFLTGNWDRWSGFNVATAHGKMLYVDNDGAFFPAPPAEGLARNRRWLDGTERFSKRLVDRLRAMSDADVRSALGEESPGVPLLSEKALDGVLARKKELLAAIDDKNVDWFP